MTPQEQQLIADLFDRLASVEGQPRDPDADRLIRQGLARAPSAMYALVQTVLVQDEVLKRANARIEELERAAAAPAPAQGGGFLDSMRNLVGGSPRSSVPSVRPGGQGSSGVWGAPGRPAAPPQTGYPQQAGYPQPGYPPGGYPGQPGYPPGAPMAPMAAAPARGGSFLGTAAAAAAGVVGGGLLLGGIRNMMGGEHGPFGGSADTSGIGTGGGGSLGSSPWDRGSDQMSRDAGLNDIGGGGHAAAPDNIGDSGFYTPGDDQPVDQGGDYDTGYDDAGGFDSGDSDIA